MKIIQFLLVALLGVLVGLIAPAVNRMISKEEHTKMKGLERLFVDAKPHLSIEAFETDRNQLWVNLYPSDGTWISIMCDADGLIKMTRSYSDNVNEYVVSYDSVDWLPASRTTKDLKTRKTVTEYLKTIPGEKKAGVK